MMGQGGETASGKNLCTAGTDDWQWNATMYWLISFQLLSPHSLEQPSLVTIHSPHSTSLPFASTCKEGFPFGFGHGFLVTRLSLMTNWNCPQFTKF